MKIVVVMIVALICAGCATREGIKTNYAEKVYLEDGISEQEAKMIAQKKIINTAEQRYYRITAPAIARNRAALQYPDYWFVMFGHNWFSPISTESTKTYTQLKEAVYLVVINKNTGFVKFYGEYFPKEADHFDWVFDTRSYRSVLEPIPGMPSIDLQPGF